VVARLMAADQYRERINQHVARIWGLEKSLQIIVVCAWELAWLILALSDNLILSYAAAGGTLGLLRLQQHLVVQEVRRNPSSS
jgi:hypothetical protein